MPVRRARYRTLEIASVTLNRSPESGPIAALEIRKAESHSTLDQATRLANELTVPDDVRARTRGHTRRGRLNPT